MEFYTFIDDQNEKHEFEIIEVFLYGEQKYAIVQEKDQEDALIMRYQEQGDEMLLEIIEEEQEFEDVRDAYESDNN